MDALQKLKEIGKEKIREKTNLDLGKIEDILEKRFEKIAPVRAKGFIQVLQKAYGLDLSSWLEEYYEFQTNHKEKPRVKQEISQDKSSYLFWVACIALVVVGGGVLYWIYIKSHTLKTAQLQNIKQNIQVESHQAEMTEVLKQEDVQSPILEEKVKEENLRSEEQDIQTPPKAISEYGKSVFGEIAYNEENVLFISAETPLWVGIINLDTKKRIAKTKKEFEIPLDKQLLINIARGGFNASLDDEEKYFNTYKPVYLIYTIKGGLREISKEEFMGLNGGVEW